MTIFSLKHSAPLVRSISLASVALLLFSGCGMLSQLKDGLDTFRSKGDGSIAGFKKPEIKVSGVKLKRAPTNRELAATLCHKRAPGFLCSMLGLRMPSQERLSFVFELELEVTNPNTIPIPAVEVLTAFTAYPDEAYRNNLGAVCIALCPSGESCSTPRQGTCKSSSRDIRSLSDFGTRAAGFLLAVARGDASFSDLKVKTVGAGKTMRVKVTYKLGVAPALDLIQRASKKAVAAIKARRIPEFKIPYTVQGTLFFEVKRFGRIAASFGPMRSEWKLK